MSKNLLLVARRWAKRSQFTSVERFLDFFPQAQTVTSADAAVGAYRLMKFVSQRAQHDGYTSHSLGLELSAIRKTVRHRPEIVHFLYADHDYHYAGRVIPKLGAQLVGTFWFSVEEFERRMPNKAPLQKLDLVIATGQKQQEYLEQHVPPDRVTYLPLGVDTEFFNPGIDPGTSKEKSPPRILQVGVNRRDFQALKIVYRRLRVQFPELILDMVGCPDAQELFESEFGPSVLFHPRLNDEQLREVYRRATLLILPLLEGGSSNALNEAMATGLPIVATHQPNLEDYVSSDAVILCPAGETDMMVSACNRLLVDAEYRTNMGERARRHALQYDWSLIRQRLLDLYATHLDIEL